jgi:DnaK suppressor protein
MPTKRAAAKPAKPKKAEKPKLTAKKPAAKTVAAKAPAKSSPAKASAAKPTASAKAVAAPKVSAPKIPAPKAPAAAAPKAAPAAHVAPVAQAIRRSAPAEPIVVTATAMPSSRGAFAATGGGAVNDNEGDDSDTSSLLAGPRNVQPYIAKRGETYMNKEQLEHFRNILNGWKRDLMEEVDRTVSHMKDEAANFPDPNDRATQEEEFSLELRTRDRERKLIRKIDEALKRVEDGSYGYCLETGEEIGVKRLEARPVATLTIEAQERRERRERQYGDRDDRYR